MNGRLFGLITLMLVVVLALRLVVNMVARGLRGKSKKLPAWLGGLNRLLNRIHRYVGTSATITVLIHLLWMWTAIGRPSISGLAASFFLLLQATSGLGMLRRKGEDRRKIARAHTILGAGLVIAVIVHRLPGL